MFPKRRGREDAKYGENVGVERINGFSDSVFAVAITLLILTIVVPEVSDIGQLSSELTALWPKFMGFLISFLVIGAFWMEHHAIFGYLRHWAPGLLRINLILLMFVVLLPFSTDLMSEYGNSVIANVFYDINMVVVALLLSLLWFYASYHKNLVDESVGPALRRHLLASNLNTALIFLISIGIAFINISASKFFYLALIPNEIVLGRIMRKKQAADEAQEGSPR